ncbi:MAG: CvpA family protein [Alphaproteobacteria bacterium]|nr:CvpA family protein [Alphaproteobacteria bacterium]
MEFFGISLFDLVVLGTFSLAALIGLVSGFVRPALFVASWFVAIIAALFFYPQASELAGRFFRQDWAIILVAGLVPFLIVLGILTIVGQVVAQKVRIGKLKSIDRALGVFAGLASGASVLAVAYLALDAYYPDNKFPGWVSDAVSQPYIADLADWGRAVLPDDIFNRSMESIVDAADATRERVTR